MSDNVRLLTTEEDKAQYANVSKYCFFDTDGWSDRFLRKEVFRGRLYGCCEQGRVMSGVVSHDLSVSYWGEHGIPSSGIGGVASDPIVRNKGHIRDIMNRLLKDDYKDGRVLSFLYPFSYRYYGMFGYGTMGHCFSYQFNPEEIVQTSVPVGDFTLFDGSREQYEEFLSLTDGFARGFYGGVALGRQSYPLDFFNEDLKRERRFLYFYRDDENRALGYLLYKMERGERQQKIRIIKSAWTSPYAFRSLVHFLWRHRSQVGEVLWTLPPSVPLDLLFKEPRIHRDVTQMWMGRPINVIKALEIKSRSTPVETPFRFSLEDPVLPENSGTYQLEGEKVTKSKTDPSIPPLEFSVFSALVMGGSSLDEARMAGKVPEGFVGDGAYLARLGLIGITEGF